MAIFNTGEPENFYTSDQVDTIVSTVPNGGGHSHDTDHIVNFPDKVRFYACAGCTTAGRPPGGSISVGHIAFDTTLGIPIWWDGSVWKDATGTTV